jgi:hypothetical protein
MPARRAPSPSAAHPGHTPHCLDPLVSVLRQYPRRSKHRCPPQPYPAPRGSRRAPEAPHRLQTIRRANGAGEQRRRARQWRCPFLGSTESVQLRCGSAAKGPNGPLDESACSVGARAFRGPTVVTQAIWTAIRVQRASYSTRHALVRYANKLDVA